MKKNILKKINPPSFDSFLRNLGRFLLFESRKTLRMCNFCRETLCFIILSTYQQVRMLTLLQNCHQQLFCIKKRKTSAHIYFSSYEISIFRLFRGTKRNKNKILPGFVKNTLVK